MDAIIELLLYLLTVGIVSIVLYYVIKKAVKDAIRETQNDKGGIK